MPASSGGDAFGEEASGGETLREIFATHGRARRVGPNQALFLEGDAPRSVLFVVSGLVRIETTTSDGRVVLLDLASDGDLIGELGVVRAMSRSAAAWTVQESVVLELSDAEFMHMMERDSTLAIAALIRTADRLGEITFQLVEASAFNAASRTAARIIRLAEVAGISLDSTEPAEIKMPITQTQLGEWAGLRREGVAAGLARLRGLDIIATRRMHMTVLDAARLRRIAFGREP